MSTTFPLGEQTHESGQRVEFSITEHSTVFDIEAAFYESEQVDPEGDLVQSAVLYSLTAEQVVDIAMKLLQPTLYNVSDPKAFMENVIRKKLGELFV